MPKKKLTRLLTALLVAGGVAAVRKRRGGEGDLWQQANDAADASRKMAAAG